MPPEAADKAIICAAGQASPWFVWCWSLVLIHLGSSLRTLVDLCWMPNDAH